MFNKNLFTPLLFLFTVLTLAFFHTIFTPKMQTVPKKALTPVPTSTSPESTLSFSPNTITVNAGETAQTQILINSQGMIPTLAQLEIAYDPLALSQVSLTPDTFFPNPAVFLSQIDEKTGRISYALGAASGKRHLEEDSPPVGQVPLGRGEKNSSNSGRLAKLKFTINKNAPLTRTTLTFLPKTEILSQKTNIPLKIAYGLKIIINSQIPASASAQFR